MTDTLYTVTNSILCNYTDVFFNTPFFLFEESYYSVMRIFLDISLLGFCTFFFYMIYSSLNEKLIRDYIFSEFFLGVFFLLFAMVFFDNSFMSSDGILALSFKADYSGVIGLVILGLTFLVDKITCDSDRNGTLDMPYVWLTISVTFFITVLFYASNLMSIFVSLEGMSFSLYMLAALNLNSHGSVEAAIKYFCLGSISSGFFLYGISLIYGLFGSTNLFSIKEYSLEVYWTADPLFFMLGSTCILIGILFKISAFPFHI